MLKKIKYKFVSKLLKIKDIYNKIEVWYCQENVKRVVKSYGEGLKINGITKLTTKTKLGNNCSFNGMIIAGGGNVVIGNNFHSGIEILIINQIHNYDKGTEIPYDSTYIYKDVVIEDNVWLGSRVTILGGVTIGEGAIIQAGSTVVSDIPKFAIAGGHPAKVFKYRDIEHYNKLKDKGLFH